MNIAITRERPDTPDARALIDELEAELSQFYPPASRHGYAVDKLIAQGVVFFVARVNDMPAGCGGVQIFGPEYGELKRMYAQPAQRGIGLGRALMEHLMQYTRAQGVPLLRLETGVHQTAAIALYERAGFIRIPPFGPYTDDPLSLCYELRIGGTQLS